MPCQLRSSDNQLFELNDGVAQQIITLQVYDTHDAPLPVPQLDSARLAKVVPLLAWVAEVVAAMPEDRRPELGSALPRGAALEDDMRAAFAALPQQGIAGLADMATLLRDVRCTGLTLR